MLKEEISAILEQYDAHNSNNAQILDQLVELEPRCESLADIVAILYSKCVILDSISDGSKDDEFLRTLNELDSILSSGIVDVSALDEMVFYNIAGLYFKRHDYKSAIKYIDKSIMVESGIQSHDGVEIRLKKRFWKAFSYEYLDAPSLENKYDTKNLVEAIYFITGKKIDDFPSSSEALNRNTKYYDEFDGNILSIIEDLCEKQSTSSLFYYIYSAYCSGLIQEEIYNRAIFEIAHIVAHCFSEYSKNRVANNKKKEKRIIFFIRLAELLMKRLGHDYITCYATLKIENKEYFSAIDSLFRVKASIEQRTNSEKNDREIAQINFYIWYFSFVTRISGRSVECKEAFLKYCNQYNNPVALLYYHVLNFKEQLSDGFSLLRQGESGLSQIKKNEIDKEYQTIKNELIIPKTIHQDILNERSSLLHAYDLFVGCYQYIQNRYTESLHIYKMERLLTSYLINHNYSSANFSSQGVKKIIDGLKNSKQGFFYVLEFSGNKIIYKGSKDAIIEVLCELNIQLSHVTIKKVENIISLLSTNCSNICISATDDYFDEDMRFIREIISYDEQHSAEECHNLYIDISNLCQNNQSMMNLEISQCYNSVIDVFNNLSLAVYIGLLFAMIESSLYKLHLPLEAYVISPIEETESYSFQSVPRIELLNYSYFERIQSKGNVKNWIRNFGVCFSIYKKKETNKKELLVESIRNNGVDIDSIEQVIYFENTSVQQLCVYVFDISKDVRISDGVIIYDDTKELSTALQKIYNEFHNNKNHENASCSVFPCNSIFSYIDIGSINYKSFRGLLYSYVGMMLPQKVFVLLRGVSFSGENNYLLCVLKDGLTEDQEKQIKLCHNMRYINTYLREVDNLTSESIFKDAGIKVKQNLTYDASSDTQWIDSVLIVPEAFDEVGASALEKLKEFLHKHMETPIAIPPEVWATFEKNHRIPYSESGHEQEWSRAEAFYQYVKGKLSKEGKIDVKSINSLIKEIFKLYSNVYNGEQS